MTVGCRWMEAVGRSQPLLRDARAQGDAGRRDHRVGIGVRFDVPVYRLDRRHDHAARDHLESPACVPQIRIGERALDVRKTAHGQESEPLRFDRGLKIGIGEQGRAVPSGLERKPEADERMHVARAAESRQQHVQAPSRRGKPSAWVESSGFSRRRTRRWHPPGRRANRERGRVREVRGDQRELAAGDQRDLALLRELGADLGEPSCRVARRSRPV